MEEKTRKRKFYFLLLGFFNFAMMEDEVSVGFEEAFIRLEEIIKPGKKILKNINLNLKGLTNMFLLR